MEIMVVDDEQLALDNVMLALEKLNLDANIAGFRKASEALEYAFLHKLDIAFLDIEMRNVSGVDLAKNLKRLNPLINLIFTTGYKDYTSEAMDLHASGYILKPITSEKIKQELADLRYNIDDITAKSKLRIVTFGNFGVYNGDIPVKFKYRKTLEVLAYLVDRKGAFASNGELIAALWEDEGDYEGRISYLNNIRADLKKTLSDLGYGDAIIQQRGHMAIDAKKISCDYYEYLNGKLDNVNGYHGEYMSQYSWAEITNGSLMIDLKKA